MFLSCFEKRVSVRTKQDKEKLEKIKYTNLQHAVYNQIIMRIRQSRQEKLKLINGIKALPRPSKEAIIEEANISGKVVIFVKEEQISLKTSERCHCQGIISTKTIFRWIVDKYQDFDITQQMIQQVNISLSHPQNFVIHSRESNKSKYYPGQNLLSKLFTGKSLQKVSFRKLQIGLKVMKSISEKFIEKFFDLLRQKMIDISKEVTQSVQRLFEKKIDSLQIYLYGRRRTRPKKVQQMGIERGDLDMEKNMLGQEEGHIQTSKKEIDIANEHQDLERSTQIKAPSMMELLFGVPYLKQTKLQEYKGFDHKTPKKQEDNEYD